jgi:hypothetical protein
MHKTSSEQRDFGRLDSSSYGERTYIGRVGFSFRDQCTNSNMSDFKW